MEAAPLTPPRRFRRVSERPPFQGLVLGLNRSTVERILRLHGLALRVDAYLPPLSLALGLPGRRFLERKASLGPRVQYAGRGLMTAWGGVAVLFFLLLGSFVLDLWEAWRVPLLVATAVVGLAALVYTFILYRRSRWGGELDEDSSEFFPLDFVLVAPDLVLVGLALALAVLFFGFVLLVLWIPALFLLVNVLALGELWRSYQTVFLSGEGAEEPALEKVAAKLLRRGGILSRSWMLYLTGETRHLATRLRKAHLRVHSGLLLLGVMSLGFAGLFVGSRVFQSPAWGPVLLFTGVLALLALGGLLWALYRRARMRTTV